MNITTSLLTTLFCIVLKCFYLCVIKVNKHQKQLKFKKMNTQRTSLLKVANTTETANSTFSVNENGTISQKKTFTAADLWNIQRNSRTLFGRRRCA